MNPLPTDPMAFQAPLRTGEKIIAAELHRAAAFGSMLDALFQPTPAQVWLTQAAAELERQRDPGGARSAKNARLKIEVMERDGSDCWFCGEPLNGDVTLEHLQPRALGGDWRLDNLALAHRGCNKTAGHLSRIKKEALREERISKQSSREREAGNRLPSD